MSTEIVHFSIDIGPWWTAAVLHLDDRRVPVLLDGLPRMPSGLFIDRATGTLIPGSAGLAAGHQHPDDYVTDPLAQLQTDSGQIAGYDPIVGVGTMIAYVANAASVTAGAAITAFALTIPEPWGPRRRARLTQAAAAVGLPAPYLITASAALAALFDSAPDSTEAGYVLLGRTDGSHVTLTVLDVAHDHTELASTVVHDPAYPGVDQALAALARLRAAPGESEDPAAGWQAMSAIDQARQQLAGLPRAPVLLPGQHQATVIDRDDLARAAEPHLRHLDAALLSRLLTDADIEPAQLTLVIAAGGDDTVRLLAGRLAAAGYPPSVIIGQPYAAADGAWQATHDQSTPATATTAATTRLPRSRLTPTAVTATAALAIAALLLTTQALTVEDYVAFTGDVHPVWFAHLTLAAAAAVAAIAGMSAATLTPTTWITRRYTAATAGTLLRTAYLTAAASALLGAVITPIYASTEYTQPVEIYRHETLIATVPLAAAAVVIGIVVPRLPATALQDWLHRAKPPLIPILVATIGFYLDHAVGAGSFPINVLGFPDAFWITGLTCIGFATGYTAFTQPLLKHPIAIILGLTYGLTANPRALPTITYIYLAALALWAATLAAHTCYLALRADTRRLATDFRLAISNQPPPSQ